MNHPSAIDLEAFACGDLPDAVATHIDGCEACAAHVARLRALAPAETDRNARFARALAAHRASSPPATTSERSPNDATPSLEAARAKKRNAWSVAAVLVPLAAAAALLLLRGPADDPLAARDLRLPTAVAPTTPSIPSTVDTSDTTFKGQVQLAVIRERAGHQERFTSIVRVRPGDRLRLEVALDREQAILGGVIADDGSYLELMPSGVRNVGTHLSERAAKVDASKMEGTIVIGAPDAIAAARAVSRRRAPSDIASLRVATLRIEWEGP